MLRLISISFGKLAGFWESGEALVRLTAEGKTCSNRLRNRTTPCGHFNTGYGHGIET